MLRQLRRDIQSVFERDPAARSTLEVLLCYPGVHAIFFHRIAHRLWRRGWVVTARLLSQLSRFLTQIEIHPGARIGQGLFIDHGAGVVIGETAEVGDNVTIYQGVTLGGTGKERGKRHPTIGDNVVIGGGARILGSFRVGDNCMVGSGAVLLKEVPDNCTVVGNPGRIVRQNGRRVAATLNHTDMPDPVAAMLDSLQRQVEELQLRLDQVTLQMAEGKYPGADGAA